MRLVEHNHRIQTLPTDRPHKPLHRRGLPRRTKRDQHLPDAHVFDSLAKRLAVDRIPVADQVLRHFIPRERLDELLRGPLLRGMLGQFK